MEVRKPKQVSDPGYPNRRQFAESAKRCGVAAAIGLGVVGTAYAADATVCLPGSPQPSKEAPAQPMSEVKPTATATAPGANLLDPRLKSLSDKDLAELVVKYRNLGKINTGSPRPPPQAKGAALAPTSDVVVSAASAPAKEAPVPSTGEAKNSFIPGESPAAGVPAKPQSRERGDKVRLQGVLAPADF